MFTCENIQNCKLIHLFTQEIKNLLELNQMHASSLKSVAVRGHVMENNKVFIKVNGTKSLQGKTVCDFVQDFVLIEMVSDQL